MNNRKTIIVMMSGGRVQPQGTVARSPSIEETTERFAHGVVHGFAVCIRRLARARQELAGRRHVARSRFSRESSGRREPIDLIKKDY